MGKKQEKTNQFTNPLDEVAYLRKVVSSQKGASNRLRRELNEKNNEVKMLEAAKAELEALVIDLRESLQASRKDDRRKPWYKRIF